MKCARILRSARTHHCTGPCRQSVVSRQFLGSEASTISTFGRRDRYGPHSCRCARTDEIYGSHSRFAVPHPGRVLLYPAEDATHIVRRRLDGICAAAGVRLDQLDIQVITAPSLRLDLDADRSRLEETVAQLKPRLLILDPFVRLHRIDENASGEVAPLLAFLRDLQRHHAISVVLVHHARKAAAALRAGQALRGSSEFHAWGDSNLYLRRDGDQRIILTVEHRAAAAIPNLPLALTQHDKALALSPIQNYAPPVTFVPPHSINGSPP